MVTHEDPELTSSPTLERQRYSLTKTPTQQGGISWTEPLPEERRVCLCLTSGAPTLGPAPVRWGPQNIQLWNQWDPGVLWGSEIPLLRSLNTETHPGNQSKGSSLRGDQIIHEGNSAASLKTSARGTGNIPGLSWGGRGAGKRHSAFSPSLGAQRGIRDTASWKLRVWAPPCSPSAPLKAGVPCPPHSFPTLVPHRERLTWLWWPEGLMLLGPAGPWQSESHFNILTFFFSTVSV